MTDPIDELHGHWGGGQMTVTYQKGSPMDLKLRAEAEKDYQNKQAQQAYLDAIRASAQGFGGAGNSQSRSPSGYGSYGAGSGTNQTLG